MRYCPTCGAQLSDQAFACPRCGASANQGNYGGNSFNAPSSYNGGNGNYNAGGYGPGPNMNNGYPPQYQQPYRTPTSSSSNDMTTLVLIFNIISCIIFAAFLLPLAWRIPITIIVYKRMSSGQPVGIALKICTLLFVSLIGGIILLCSDC